MQYGDDFALSGITVIYCAGKIVIFDDVIFIWDDGAYHIPV
jgi:hypothetical protein